MDIHDLTAGYALDALDHDERERYEAHLGTCEPCREELQGFWQVSAALGRAAGGPTPPASLRTLILEQAREERPNVIPFRRRLALPVLSSAAAVAAVVAVAFGIWALGLSSDLDEANSVLAVLGDPNARVHRSADGEANLVVTPTGAAALVVRRLGPAPEGKDYEIWVIENGTPQRAGLFDRPGVSMLSRRVSRGQTVVVTLEPDGGVDAPTGKTLFTAASI